MWHIDKPRTTCVVLLLLSLCTAIVHVPGSGTARNLASDVVDMDVAPKCSPREITGVFVNYTFVGSSGCTFQFLRYPHLALATLEIDRVWIHFIGDSDTRGLVLGLLRLIYPPLSEAVTVEDFAEAYGCSLEPELLKSRQAWCGGVVNLTQLNRIRYVDYQFAYADREDSPMLSLKRFVAPGLDRWDMNNNVSKLYRLRISYEMSGPEGMFDAALEYWNDEHNDTFPDVFYLNIGAWYGKSSVNEEQLQRVTTGIERLLSSAKRIIYGTSLFWRQHAFDDAVSVVGALKSTHLTHQVGEIQIFDRETFSNLMFRHLGLEKDTGHAPFLVNLFDAQRLVQLISWDTCARQSGDTWVSPTHFHDNCTSSKHPEHFISTWSQHCEMS